MAHFRIKLSSKRGQLDCPGLVHNMNILESPSPRISKKQRLSNAERIRLLVGHFDPELVAVILRVDEHWHPAATHGFDEDISFTEPPIQAALFQTWSKKKNLLRLEAWMAEQRHADSKQLSTIWSIMTVVSPGKNSTIYFLAKRIKNGAFVQTSMEELEEMVSTFEV